MSATDIIVGGEPRIDLLPPEIAAAKKSKGTIRMLIGLVIIVGAVAAAAYAGVTVAAINAQTRLDAAQERTQQLLREQGQYSEVRSLVSELARIDQVQVAASDPEVMWRDRINETLAVLPADATVLQYAATSRGIADSGVGSSGPLAGIYVAEVTFVLHTPTVPATADWMDALKSVRGVTDVWLAPLTNEGGGYDTTIRVSYGDDALENRFIELPEDDADAAAEEETE